MPLAHPLAPHVVRVMQKPLASATDHPNAYPTVVSPLWDVCLFLPRICIIYIATVDLTARLPFPLSNPGGVPMTHMHE